MKAIVILYTGHKPIEQEIVNGLLNFGVNPESATVKVLDDGEVRNLMSVGNQLKQILEVPVEPIKYENVDWADDAADVVINVTKGINRMDITKNALMLLRHNSGDGKTNDVAREFVKACEILKSGRIVSNGWLQRHGLSRREWEGAQAFINRIM